jgi:XRE family transcriptional regulator of biofilm formation
MEQFGKNLRAYRKERRMTQTELASLVGVAPAYVSQIESSLRMPSLRVARRFAESLRVELPILLGTAEPADPRGLSDTDKLEMLRTVVRALERDLDDRAACEVVEDYPDSEGLVVSRSEGSEVRVYRFVEGPDEAGREAMFRHEAQEVLYCAQGTLHVRIGDETYVVSAGSTRSLPPSEPHLVRGEPGSVCVSTVTPPFAAADLETIASGEGARSTTAARG